MVFSVTEWLGNERTHVFFDASKVSRAIPFEVAYGRLCELAAAEPHATLLVCRRPDLAASVEDRFSTYQDGERCWTRLHARLPCVVDVAVILVLDE